MLEGLGNNIVKSVIYIIIVIVIIYYIYNSYQNFVVEEKNAPWLIEGTKQGTGGTRQVPGELIPRSEDEQYGIEFSYSMWIFIDNNNVNYNTDRQKHIFHKGSSSGYPLQCPGVWLDNKINTMYINFNTFSNMKETIQIDNLPMGKWFHLSIVVMNRFVDVYINGGLKNRYKLEGIIKQNYDDIWITNWGGFSGFLSKFRYFAYALPYWKIEQLMKDLPTQAPCVDSGAVPPYLSERYWLQTGFPA